MVIQLYGFHMELLLEGSSGRLIVIIKRGGCGAAVRPVHGEDEASGSCW